MLNEQKASPPQAHLERVDFTLESLCEGCPLRQAAFEGFNPAYGIAFDSYEDGTSEVDVINFEILFEQTRGRATNANVKYRAVLNAELGRDVEQTFEDCEMPSELRHLLWPNRIVCTALNRLLTDKVPTKNNLRIDKLEYDDGLPVKRGAL